MGEIVEFPSNGSTAQGYLATPESGTGPGVVVIQEWWGLVEHIKDVADRLAGEGFVALVPDLYHGEAASTKEPDEAGKLMMSLNLEQAAKDMSGAVDYVATHSNGKVGVIGFCMGGALALLLGTLRPDVIKAVVPFYGVIGWPATEPDWSKMTAAVQGHYAENDDMAGPAAVEKLEKELGSRGVDVELFLYPGTTHAFFNDTRPEVHDPEASALAWQRSVDFLRAHLS
ncbi:MAG TPA: dienelactone hydrolase family protein [Acidimicrobiales bacterium]|jgi:carboxymethylenebutenolidase|nr:dienelactone hydrolase family protein [Acidimicrobiales bacterium]